MGIFEHVRDFLPNHGDRPMAISRLNEGHDAGICHPHSPNHPILPDDLEQIGQKIWVVFQLSY